MTSFGTLEYVLDKFSGTWSWKITGERAVAMVSKIIPQAWYGDHEFEAIVPDDPKNLQQIKWIMDRYPLEIISKNVWQRKLPPSVKAKQQKPKRTEKLRLATPGKQFKGTLFNFQREALDFLIKSSGNALLADDMGLGKCIRGTSIVETINGPVQIADLWKTSHVTDKNGDEEWAKLAKPLAIQTFDGYKIISKKINRIFRQKISEPIAKVTLLDGSEIECTKRHKFLTPDGWKMAGDLTVNDKVAVPAKTLHAGKNSLKPDLAELMAWQLAEGYEFYSPDGCVSGHFNNSDLEVLARVREIAKSYGMSLPIERKNRTTFVISTTRLYSLFSRFGYPWGKKPADKFIPKSVLESSLETQKAFIQAIFDAEGYIGKTHCEFTTASKHIAYGMRDMLRHFGIWLRIRVGMKCATNGAKIKRPYYICTFGGNSIERFVTQFRLRTKRKQIALELLAKRHNTNIEGTPSQKIVQKIANNGMSLRPLELFSQYKTTQGMSKELACFIIDKLESAKHTRLANEPQKLALKSIHWCGIRKIETIDYDGFVYDLSVPTTHNYVANGMITHNTIETLAYLSTEKNAFPALIVAPLVTLQNWQREIEKFLKRKSRNGRLIDDESPTSTIIRVGKSEDIGKYDFYIINYELLYKRYKDLAKLNLRTIVCDEVQHLRSKTTQKYHAIKKLAALESVKYRIGLSGTPIYNRGSEIWPIVDILRPGLLGSFKEFCEYFCYINEKGKAIVVENKRESLRQMLQKHVMLRRKKTDVLSELKEKVRYKEVIDADINYYNTELEKIWKKLEEDRKVAQTAFDASTAFQRAIQSERQAAGVAKLPHVINFVKNIMEIEESVVVFCHHKAIHSLLHQSLAEFKPASIIGGQTDKERQQNIDAFQNGETKLMIAGLRAGNVGINLTRARYVIFAELDWSPAIHLQAEDRCIEQGQLVYVLNKGLIEIEKVELNDRVLTHLGNWKKVQKIRRREHRGLMTEITYYRYDKALRCTHDHKIFVLKQNQTKPTWINAHEILPGDFVLMPIPTKTMDKTFIDIPTECFHNPCQTNQFGAISTNGRYVQIQRRTELDHDLLYLFGWYVAEGFSSTSEEKGRFISLSGHIKEKPILEKLGERLRKFGATYSIYCKENKAELRAYSIELAKWFGQWFGRTSYEKRIPEFILDLPTQKLKTFFVAYCKGDGYFRNNQQEWVTVSRKLASQINLIALKCGFMPTLREIDSGKNSGQWIGGYTTNGNPDNKKLNRKDNEFCYNPVKKVTTYNDKTTVYDLTVEDDHSFVVGQAIVHNCHRIGQKNTVFAYYLMGNGTLDEHVARILVDKSYEIDSIMDNKTESFENKEKAQLILAQIQDKVKSIIKN